MGYKVERMQNPTSNKSWLDGDPKTQPEKTAGGAISTRSNLCGKAITADVKPFEFLWRMWCRKAACHLATALAVFAGFLVLPTVVALQLPPSTESNWGLPAGREWPLVNGDWQNSRYSTLSQINREDVKDLLGAWTSETFDDGAMSRSTPVVKDGLMFVTAGTRVYALDAKDGKIVWRYRTDARKPVSGLETTRGQAEVIMAGNALPNSQGVGLGDGLVFAGLTDGKVIALNQKTGLLQWSRQIGNDPPVRGQSVSSAPIYADGLVFCGLANGDFGLRGRVVALDARTGNEVWHFFAIPGPGEVGHDTWPENSEVWKRGGGGVWQSGAVDPVLGAVYFAVGNPVPQTGGEVRQGDNLFTGSVVALDMRSGKLLWYFQGIHHDIWDADGFAPTPLILYDAQVSGRPRKGLAAMRADGYLFLLDRETGKPLIPVEERPVPQNAHQQTAATQPFPVRADSILPGCSEWKDKIPPGFVLGCTYSPHLVDKPNILAPGFGVRVSPMSYSPQTQYFYAQGNATLGGRRRFSEDPWFFTPSATSGGVALLDIANRNFIAAIDSRNDKVVWKHEVPAGNFGRSGTFTTAGGLVFQGGEDGNFKAYDARTGELLWQFQVGSPGTPASTYEIDGEQYVAIAAGAHVWAFKLGGNIKPVVARPEQAAGVGASNVLPIDVTRIETTSLVRDMGINGGQRYSVDEYTFNPVRARVKAGTRVTWTNNGRLVHTIVAQDGSWTTGVLQPAQESSVTFDRPGTFTYICKDHPWAYGQVVVIPQNSGDIVPNVNQTLPGSAQAAQSASGGFYTREQARRGQTLYVQSCSNCHLVDLSGSGMAPPLAGQQFTSRWDGRSVGDLFVKIRTSMPVANPGSLSPGAYLDIVGFLLQSNGFPAGQGELKNSPKTLDSLKMTKP
jgi:quinohemoprotein ethanol dehydrogenase